MQFSSTKPSSSIHRFTLFNSLIRVLPLLSRSISTTPLLIPSVRTLGPSSVRRSIGILHPVSLPTCPRKKEDKGTLFGLMFQRFLFYARASTRRLLYTSFSEFYIGRIKRRERVATHRMRISCKKLRECTGESD